MGNLSGRFGRLAGLALGMLLAACSNDGSAAASGGAASSSGGAASAGGDPSGGAATASGGIASGGAATASGGIASGGAATANGGSASGGTAADAMSLEQARASYKTFMQRTVAPIPISEEIFSLCRLPTLPEQAFVKSEHGNGLYLLDWLNPDAQQGYAQKSGSFAVGSVIVKEKLSMKGSAFDVAALGIMIKHSSGFDAAHGDWEFGYWEPDAGLLSGEAESTYCGACHSGSSTDFVFLDNSWRYP